MGMLIGARRVARVWALAWVGLVGCDDVQEAAPVRLGLLAAFTAAGNEGNGIVERRSVELAIEEVNAAGGALPGRRVELLSIDYGETVTTVLAAGETIAGAGLHGLVGPEPTIVESLLVDGFVGMQLPHVSCCASSERLVTAAGQTGTDRYFFRTTPSDSAESVATARVVRECGTCSSVVVFHQNDDYGIPFAERLIAELADHGGPEVALDVAFPQGQSSYEAQVTAAAATSADCAVVIGFPAESGRVRRNWQTYAGRSVQWFAASPVTRASSFLTELGDPTGAAGMLAAAPTADPLAPHVADFRSLYKGRFRDEPALSYASRNYDAAALLLLAIARAGTTEGERVRDALYEVSRPDPDDVVVGPGDLAKGIAAARRGLGINYEGGSGDVDFDETGGVASDYEVIRFDASGAAVSLGLVRPSVPLPCAP